VSALIGGGTAQKRGCANKVPPAACTAPAPEAEQHAEGHDTRP
jgi:hypothetical protein